MQEECEESKRSNLRQCKCVRDWRSQYVVHFAYVAKCGGVFSDLEIPKNLSILQSPDIWIASSDALNDGTADKKGILNLRKDEWIILGDNMNSEQCCEEQILMWHPR